MGVKQKAPFPLSGRDPLTISQGVGKLERILWEDEKLERRITDSYRHVSPKIFNEFPKVLDQVSLELGKQKEQYKISTESKVDNPLMSIENFNRQFQLGEKEREAIKWGWDQEMGNTMFHLVNAYTRAARVEGLTAEASYRFQKVGGMVLGMVK